MGKILAWFCGYLPRGVDWFLLRAGAKVGILEGESESFLLRPVGKVGILKEDLNFKGEFLANFNWKLEFFAKIWTLGSGVLKFIRCEEHF